MRFNLTFIVVFFLLSSCSPDYIDWPVYLGSKEGTQFSTASLITKENVKDLKVAWEYSSGDAHPKNRSQIQCNPLIVDGVLYGSTASLKFFALDARSGKQLWKFDPYQGGFTEYGMGFNRGLAFYSGDDQRLFLSTGSNLFCLDASSGKPIPSFGDGGKIDLKKRLDRDVDDRLVLANTPGVIYKDKIIVGTRVDEASGAAPGHIRAYNVFTGEMEWIFHTIPHPGEFGYDTWPKDAWKEIGGANSWAGMSLDEERGIVYVPTGSASYDFYGGDRAGQNLFANCILALNASTGERIWHFQTTHHDMWDRDLPAPPVLSSINVNGEERDVVMQTSKQGYVFVFDRETGEPIFPIEEVPVPTEGLPGETPWPTQPIPVKPPPYTRVSFTEEDATNISPESNQHVLDVLKRLKYGNGFIPPSKEGTIIFPGFDGGAEWGGAAFNPETNTLFVNANHVPWILTMVEVNTDQETNIGRGRALYTQFCAGCHGADLKGGEFMGNVPSLEEVSDRLSEDEFLSTVINGRNAMPAFKWLKKNQLDDIKSYLLKLDVVRSEFASADSEERAFEFTSTGYNKFYDPEGYLAVKPPWGTLTAIDMDKAEIAWQIPLGEHEELTERGIPITGTQNYGGPAITKNGLLFIAATSDERMRCIDQATGEILWEADLPAAGYATPSIYQIGEKEFVVIACGGGKLGTKSGDKYIAFSLPD